MAWRYPLYMIKNGYVVDNIAINKNLLSVTEETSGYLNEHNFSAQLRFIDRDNLKNGAAMKLAYSRPTTGIPSAAGENDTSRDVNLAGIPSFQTFNEAGLSLTFTSRGGPTWICASFTLVNSIKQAPTKAMFESHDLDERTAASPGTAHTTAFPLPNKQGFGFNAALQLDGVILNDSLVGTGDAGNEYYADDVGTIHTISTLHSVKLKPKGGGGVTGARNALVLDTIVDLTPGKHTVKVAVQDIQGSSRQAHGRDDAYVTSPRITTREIFALELTR